MERHEFFLSLCACLCLLAVPASAQTAKNNNNKEAVFPPELSDEAVKDFEMEDCFQEDQRPIEKQVTTERLNVTTTTNTVLLLTGTSACLSRGGNHAFLVYALFGKNWRKVLRADGATIQTLPSMNVGWHDLEVVFRKSGSENARYVFSFDKTGYRGESCETIAEPAGGGAPEHKPCPEWKKQ